MRLVDIIVSALLLVCLSPVLLAIAILVRLSSPGPVLYRHQRVGRAGRPFLLLKFRSMRVCAAGPAITASGDARITRIGRLLRKWKLDELPQLLNVLRGEMSLVGPRPEVAEYVAHYTDEQREVLRVRPGITGAAQLEFRNEEDLLAGRDDVVEYYIASVMPQKLAIDLGYLERRTLATDLGVLVRTAWVIVKRS